MSVTAAKKKRVRVPKPVVYQYGSYDFGWLDLVPADALSRLSARGEVGLSYARTIKRHRLDRRTRVRLSLPEQKRASLYRKLDAPKEFIDNLVRAADAEVPEPYALEQLEADGGEYGAASSVDESVTYIKRALTQLRLELFGRKDLSERAIYYRLKHRSDLVGGWRSCADEECDGWILPSAHGNRRLCDEHRTPAARKARQREREKRLDVRRRS
jgi:hypothetical protein